MTISVPRTAPFISQFCCRVAGGDVTTRLTVLRVNVSAHEVFGSAVVTLYKDGTGALARYPLYRIDNQCRDDVVVKQAGIPPSHSRPPWHIPAGTSRIFGWEEPSTQALDVEVCPAAATPPQN